MTTENTVVVDMGSEALDSQLSANTLPWPWGRSRHSSSKGHWASEVHALPSAHRLRDEGPQHFPLVHEKADFHYFRLIIHAIADIAVITYWHIQFPPRKHQ